MLSDLGKARFQSRDVLDAGQASGVIVALLQVVEDAHVLCDGLDDAVLLAFRQLTEVIVGGAVDGLGGNEGDADEHDDDELHDDVVVVVVVVATVVGYLEH